MRLPALLESWAHPSKLSRRFGVAVFTLCALLYFSFSAKRTESPKTQSWQAPFSSSSSTGRKIYFDESVPLLRDARNPGHVIPSPDRITDITDTFEPYTRYPGCNTSSLELHDPFSPLCPDKDSLLYAMTGGGRSGIDMPYAPRECDMRWFSHVQICDILSRFSNISIVGDSMTRNLALALHQLIRKDLFNGSSQNWDSIAEDDEKGVKVDCRCHNSYENPKCWLKGAWSTKMVLENDPESMWCPYPGTAPIEFNVLLDWPLANDAEGFTKTLPTEKPDKPHVFIYGHGLWNNVNETASTLWLEQIQENVNKTMPWLMEPNAVYPRLFVTPSCSGGGKPEKFLKTQGNPSLGRFELAMGPSVRDRGVDHLGVFNLTMQNTTPDGTHAGMHANLIKAMMVLNWLNSIDVSKY